MSTATVAYPPPLSAPPTVEVLERLLVGLQAPVERGGPTPPPRRVAPEQLFGGVPRQPRTSVSVDLNWSAGRHHTLPSPFGLLSPFAGAAAAAAAALAVVAAQGDIGLP